MKNKSYLTGIFCLAILLTGCGVQEEEEPQPKIEIAEITEPPPEAETAPETEPATDPPAPETVYISCMPIVEANTTLRLSDFVTYANVTIKDPYMEVDTSRIGEFDIIVPYYYGQETRQEIVSYQVKDTTPPVILNEGGNAWIKTGEEFDLRTLIGYGDNYNTKLTLTYDGDVDTSNPGTYMISAHLTDSSGNQSTCRLNVIVADEEPVNVLYGDPVLFEDFKEQYAAQSNAYAGVDISSWQTDVDFNAIKEAGCEFVIIRIGRGLGYDAVIDDYFEQNLAGAKKAGLKVGVYFYSIDTNTEQVRANADWIAQQLGNQELDFPIAFDWEDFVSFQDYEITLHDLNLIYHAFADQMKTHGYDTMLYSSKFFLENVWENPNKETVWLAHYTEKTDYTGNYFMWQRCNTGNIDGIAGNADFNVYREEFLSDELIEDEENFDDYAEDMFIEETAESYGMKTITIQEEEE